MVLKYGEKGVGTDGADTLFILTRIESFLASLERELLVKPDKALILSYPREGGRRAIPNGTTTLDLVAGVVTRPDIAEQMSASLKSYGLPYARSGLVWFDTDVDVEAIYNNVSMGKFSVDQCSFFPLQGVPFSALRVTSDYSFNMKGHFSALPGIQAPPQIPTGFQERYGAVTTTKDFIPVPLGPTLGGALGSGYLQSQVSCGLMGIKVISIYNNGANSLDMNLQLLLSASGTWADDPVTGTSLTLAAGNTALLETSIPTQFIRLRIRDTTAGSHSTAAVSYFAFTAVR